MSFIAGTGELKRNAMITYVNVGEGETPTWEAVGVKIEDSSIEFNPETNQITDILGINHATVEKLQPQQSFDPFTIRKESKLAEKLFDIVAIQKDTTLLSQFEVMIVYAFAGSEGKYTADKQTGCTIVANSLGGSNTLDMPIEIYYSNNSTIGYVADIKNPTFTAGTAA